MSLFVQQKINFVSLCSSAAAGQIQNRTRLVKICFKDCCCRCHVVTRCYKSPTFVPQYIPPLILFSCMQIFMFFKLVMPASLHSIFHQISTLYSVLSREISSPFCSPILSQDQLFLLKKKDSVLATNQLDTKKQLSNN